MKGIKRRGNNWMAVWVHKGKKYAYTTGLSIEGNKKKGGVLTATASEKAAERIATAWRDCAKGDITYKQAEAALEAIPICSQCGQG